MAIPKILLRDDERLAGFSAPITSVDAGPVLVGWREWAEMPELGLIRVAAKIDTGARTSALHADSIETFEKDGQHFVRFDVSGEGESVPWHEAPVADQRSVRSSNGEVELRIVIRTGLSLAGQVWPIDVSLTNRERMELPMLIGREALAGRLIVDPGRSWLLGQPIWRSSRTSPRSRSQRARSGALR